MSATPDAPNYALAAERGRSAKLEAVTIKWKAVADEVPDSDRTVLIHNAGWIDGVSMGYYNGEAWSCMDGMSFDAETDDPYEKPPTHWSNLPAPPTP